jgi:hypothetical protein
MSPHHRSVVFASFALAAAVPGFAMVCFQLDRSDFVLPLTHGAPFAVFGVIAAWLPPRSPRSLRASLGALAAGFLVVISVYAWLWYSAHYRGGGVNFAAALAYVVLAGLIGGAMHLTFSLVSAAGREPQ